MAAGKGSWKTGACLLAAGMAAGRSMGAQQIDLGPSLGGAAAHRQHVEQVTETARVRAAQPVWVEVLFRLDPGLHINSHAPHDELLVPTAFESAPGATVRVLAQRYPPGIPLRLEIGDGAMLSTYQGEFRVGLQVMAPKGSSLLTGTLRYQACNDRACFPPRSLPVKVMVTAE